MSGRRRRVHPVSAVALLLAAAGCASTTDTGVETRTGPAPAETSVTSTTHEYRAGVGAEVHLPGTTRPGPVPVVVMVPGGSWVTADSTRLIPLARTLASEGVLVVTASYRAAADDVVHPVPAQDVACAVSWAAQQAASEGYPPEPLVVVGHSAGAHLAALAALSPGEFAGSCPAPSVAPTALVGLAGPYDLTAVEGLAEPLFGLPRAEAPDVWLSADPIRRARRRPEVDVLLLHGEADRDVSPALSEVFAGALRDGGHDVTLRILPGVDHLGLVVAPEAAGPQIARWVTARTADD